MKTETLDPYERVCVGAFIIVTLLTVLGLASLVCGW